jgi:DNA-binding NarL/FixJ family response regulator
MPIPGSPADPLIRVLVTDFDPMTTRLLAADIRRQHAFDVIECRSTAEQMRECISANSPAVLLLSRKSRDLTNDRLRLLRSIRQEFSGMRIVVLVDLLDREVTSGLFRAGVRGVFECSEYDPERLCRCIECVAAGQIWAKSEHLGFVMDAFAETAPLRLLSAKGGSLLSPREKDVVQLVADGFGNREVAQQLGLSAHTVKNYLFNVFDKLGVSSRAELIMYVLADTDRLSSSHRESRKRPKPAGVRSARATANGAFTERLS